MSGVIGAKNHGLWRGRYEWTVHLEGPVAVTVRTKERISYQEACQRAKAILAEAAERAKGRTRVSQ
jgi:hypothetical protein